MHHADELIIAKEHFAEIGDDLDFTFVDLIDGIDPIWTYRRPKPPTPPPREPSPPKIVDSAAAAAAGANCDVMHDITVPVHIRHFFIPRY